MVHRHGNFANIPLLVGVYSYWFKNKEHLLSLSEASSSSTAALTTSSFNSTLETLRLSGHSDMVSYLVPIIGERMPSMLREDDLKGVGLIFDAFVGRLQDIGLDFQTNQEKLHNVLALLRHGEFTIESTFSEEIRVDIIKLLKFCKEYLKRKETLSVTSNESTSSTPYRTLGPVSEVLTRDQPAWSERKPMQKMAVGGNQLEDHIKIVNGCMISLQTDNAQQRRHHHVKAHDHDGEQVNALLHQEQLKHDLCNRDKLNREQQSSFKLLKPWMKPRDHYSPEKRHSRNDGSHSSVEYDITIPDPVSPSKLTDSVGIKVPEKRHIPSPLRLPVSTTTATTSNVFHRLRQTLPNMLDIELKKFYYSLCKSAIASGSFLTKTAIPSCLLDIGIRISHYDGELLWEDLTYGGRRLSITPRQCLQQLGVTLSESMITSVEDSLDPVREQDRVMKMMQSSPTRQSVGYDDNDIAMLRLVEHESEMSGDTSSDRLKENAASSQRKEAWTVQNENVPETVEDPVPSSPIQTKPSSTYATPSHSSQPSSSSSTMTQSLTRIRDAIATLSSKKIELALLFRKWGGSILGIRGNVLVDMLMSPSLSLCLSREEATVIVCEAGK